MRIAITLLSVHAARDVSGEYCHKMTCMCLWTGEGLSEEAVAASTQALATAVLDQGGVSEDASLMRAAAQMYACAACIGTNAAASQLIQSVCRDMAQTPVPARSSPLCKKNKCIMMRIVLVVRSLKCT